MDKIQALIRLVQYSQQAVDGSMRFNKTSILAIISIIFALQLICGETLFVNHINLHSQSINAESTPNPNAFELISIAPVLAANEFFHISKTGFVDKLENNCTSISQQIYQIAVNRIPLSVKSINRKHKGLWLLYRVILS